MSSVSMSFGRPTRLAIPRGSLWFASLAAAVLNGLHRLDRWQLERRSARVRDVQAVLAWANQVEATDPGFASDLRGAVARSSGDDWA